MTKLDLKIPPVLLVFAFAVLMWLLSRMTPGAKFTTKYHRKGALVFAITGVVLAVAGVGRFKKADTTVNPTKPEASSVLVTSGIYTHTRNPMYLGLLFLLIGWGVFLSNLLALILPAGLVLYMNHFQIIPEEIALSRLFGREYEDYKNHVRRWL